MAAQATWIELLQSCAERMREPDILTSGSTESAESRIPYSDASVVERFLYFASLLVLREVPLLELEELGSGAIEAVSVVPTAAAPLDVFGYSTATIQQVSAGPFVMADAVAPAVYFEQATVPSTISAIYTFYDGGVQFKGVTINITYLREPTLSEFQNDDIILPPGYDEARIDLVHQLMLAEDFMPMGRM